MKQITLPESCKYIAAYLTFRCNLDCGFCVNRASKKDFQRRGFDELSGEKWIEALNRLESSNSVPISLLGGEPGLHEDFIYIINNLKPELGIDILTNLWWDKRRLNKFVEKVSPERINRDFKYPQIRASYHPEQMGEGEKLLENANRLKGAGFHVGVEGIMYPSPSQLEALERMAIRCKNIGIPFRAKSFVGIYEGEDDSGRPFSMRYGNYSKYPNAAFSDKKLTCKCKTSYLLIGPNCDVYGCQRDMLRRENPTGNLLLSNFEVSEDFRDCKNYGQCHPCDVKVKTDSTQKLGHTDAEIIEIQKL